MSLHHFHWNGKERSVSVNKTSSKVTLRFIDEEIIEQGLEKISFSKNQSIENFISNCQDNKQQIIKGIIYAVKEKVDFTKFP